MAFPRLLVNRSRMICDMDDKATAVPTARTDNGAASRVFFADNWRTSIIVLVVLHHVALIYGAVSPFYYVEPPTGDRTAYLTLLVFVLLNQGWFMGALFLISGYFTPASFDRKGSLPFFRDRLLRLGIPLLIFIFVLSPISYIGLYQVPASVGGMTSPFTWQQYPKLLGVGPMWFVETLLFFDFGYAAWRFLAKKSRLVGRRLDAPGWLAAGVFVLALALASYLLRIVIPIGTYFRPLDLPTPYYIPQYLSFFIIGIVAYRNDWLKAMSRSMGWIGLGTALAVTVVLFPLALTGRVSLPELTPALRNFQGHGTWQSGVYAIWDSAYSVGLCLAAVTLFRPFFNRAGAFTAFLSRHSYTIYFVHAPLLVFVGLMLRAIDIGHLIKFLLASVIALPVCFGIAWLVRKIPLAARIL